MHSNNTPLVLIPVKRQVDLITTGEQKNKLCRGCLHLPFSGKSPKPVLNTAPLIEFMSSCLIVKDRNHEIWAFKINKRFKTIGYWSLLLYIIYDRYFSRVQ